MAAAVQDAIMLFGDSITQGGWEPGAFAQRLARQYDICLDHFLELRQCFLRCVCA